MNKVNGNPSKRFKTHPDCLDEMGYIQLFHDTIRNKPRVTEHKAFSWLLSSAYQDIYKWATPFMYME